MSDLLRECRDRTQEWIGANLCGGPANAAGDARLVADLTAPPIEPWRIREACRELEAGQPDRALVVLKRAMGEA